MGRWKCYHYAAVQLSPKWILGEVDDPHFRRVIDRCKHKHRSVKKAAECMRDWGYDVMSIYVIRFTGHEPPELISTEDIVQCS